MGTLTGGANKAYGIKSWRRSAFGNVSVTDVPMSRPPAGLIVKALRPPPKVRRLAMTGASRSRAVSGICWSIRGGCS